MATLSGARERVPIEVGFFTIPDDEAHAPRLLGSRCQRCREVFFPRRRVCAKCLHVGTDDLEFGERGTLYTWTYVHFPLFGSRRADAGGYGVGQIDTEEGPRVQAVLSGAPDDFAIGMAMQLELETLRQNKQGQEVVIYRYRPASEAGAQ